MKCSYAFEILHQADLANEYQQASAASQIESTADPMRVVYLQCDLICFTSLLCQILRAIPETGNTIGAVSRECLQAARAALALHEQCLRGLRNADKFPLMETIYVNW